jgi:uncharacterized pyridoxal phosphate-containing UPF0001 family protein
MPAQPITPDQMQCSVAEAPARIAQNWQRVQADVADAAKTNGRDEQAVRIIGVTKYVDATITQWLVDAGCHDCGENRPQLLCEKASLLSGPVRWHQIGHLQRNKVRRLLSASGSGNAKHRDLEPKHREQEHGVPLFGPTIHSIDSERLLEAVDDEAILQKRNVDLLIEINISGEDAKTGLPVDQLEPVVQRWIARRDAVATSATDIGSTGTRIVGLMAMAGWGTDADQAKRQFARLREQRDQLETRVGLKIPELSMGMSGDYPSAVAEGATMVRIGSSLFEGVL